MPIILESNQNHATVADGEVCPCLPASMGLGGGYVQMIVMQRRFSNVMVSETDIAPTIEAGTGGGGNNLPMIVDTLVFDKAQITSKLNYSVPTWGGQCHPLTSAAGEAIVIIKSYGFDEKAQWATEEKAQTLCHGGAQDGTV